MDTVTPDQFYKHLDDVMAGMLGAGNAPAVPPRFGRFGSCARDISNPVHGCLEPGAEGHLES